MDAHDEIRRGVTAAANDYYRRFGHVSQDDEELPPSHGARRQAARAVMMHILPTLHARVMPPLPGFDEQNALSARVLLTALTGRVVDEEVGIRVPLPEITKKLHLILHPDEPTPVDTERAWGLFLRGHGLKKGERIVEKERARLVSDFSTIYANLRDLVREPPIAAAITALQPYMEEWTEMDWPTAISVIERTMEAETTEQSAEPLTDEDAERLAADPDSWDALSDEELSTVLYYQCVAYGYASNLAPMDPPEPLYRYARDRLPPGDRISILYQVADTVEKHPNAYNALHPFAFLDDEFRVQCAAFRIYAALTPLEDGDPLTGPKAFLKRAVQSEEQPLRVVILSALLQLGDKRVMGVIDGTWRLLDQEGRRQLAENSNDHGLLYAGPIDFLLRWLESLDDVTDQEEFGFVATELGSLPVWSLDNKVHDIVRAFPANDHHVWRSGPDGEAVFRVAQEWTIPEFGRVIEPRLRAIRERGHERRFMDRVMASWGAGREGEGHQPEDATTGGRNERSYGGDVVQFAYETMQIDAGWTQWTERGFDWWCSDLRQRIWADPPHWDHGILIQRVNAVTELLRNVPDKPKLREQLAVTNMIASLSAFIYREDERRIMLRCSVIAHEQNVGWVKSLFAAAAAHQVADAGIKAEMGFALGGVRDSSHHPISGPRPALDQMSMVIEQLFAPAGQGESPFAQDIDEAIARPEWRGAMKMPTGILAVLPTWSADGSIVPASPNSEPTTLHVDVMDRHPQLGAGALVRLVMPIPGDFASQAESANRFNLYEAGNDANVFSLGAWCATPPPTFCHVLFLPALVRKPGLLNTIMFHEMLRAKWAASLVR